MARYISSPDRPNPFLTNPPAVVVVRHVRITQGNEVVAEDPNTLVRHLVRVDYNRVFPRRLTAAAPERTHPEASGSAKEPYT